MEDSQKPATKKQMYSPIASVLITALVFFVGQFLGALAIGFYLSLTGYDIHDIAGALHDNPWLQFGFIACVETITLYLIWVFLKHIKYQFKDVGLKLPELDDAFYALAGFVVYFLLYIMTIIVIKQLVPGLDLEQKQELGVNLTAKGQQLWPLFLSLVILPPIAEEIVARGFLYTGLRTRLNFTVAAVITSVLFGAAHLGEASDGLLWVAAIDTFVLSMVLCYLREKTGSLSASIGVHMLKNGLAFVFLFNLIGGFR